MPDGASPDHTFASDNTAGLAPEALAAFTAANAGQVASYGEDEWTARARRLIAELFETDCTVHFVFNGTAANALALAHYCRGYDGVLCHENAHIQTDECGATGFFSGGASLLTVAAPGAKLRPDDLRPILARPTSVHSPKPTALSLTQSTEMGTVYTPAEIGALAAAARDHRLTVHLDGARLANATATLAARGHSLADCTWRAGVDVLSLGGTKSGMHAAEAVVFFHPEQARAFDYRVKQAGQLGSKLRFAAAQWCGMLETGAWLRHAAHANAMAQQLSTALAGLPGVKLLHPTEANAVFVELPPAAVRGLAALGWHFHRFIGEHGYRLMCSWATRPEDVSRFVAALRRRLG